MQMNFSKFQQVHVSKPTCLPVICLNNSISIIQMMTVLIVMIVTIKTVTPDITYLLHARQA